MMGDNETGGFLIAFFTDNWIQLTTTVKYKVAFYEHRWP